MPTFKHQFAQSILYALNTMPDDDPNIYTKKIRHESLIATKRMKNKLMEWAGNHEKVTKKAFGEFNAVFLARIKQTINTPASYKADLYLNTRANKLYMMVANQIYMEEQKLIDSNKSKARHKRRQKHQLFLEQHQPSSEQILMQESKASESHRELDLVNHINNYHELLVDLMLLPKEEWSSFFEDITSDHLKTLIDKIDQSASDEYKKHLTDDEYVIADLYIRYAYYEKHRDGIPDKYTSLTGSVFGYLLETLHLKQAEGRPFDQETKCKAAKAAQNALLRINNLRDFVTIIENPDFLKRNIDELRQTDPSLIQLSKYRLVLKDSRLSDITSIAISWINKKDINTIREESKVEDAINRLVMSQ